MRLNTNDLILILSAVVMVVFDASIYLNHIRYLTQDKFFLTVCVAIAVVAAIFCIGAVIVNRIKHPLGG